MGGGQEILPHALIQQPEENGSHLGAGDAGVRPHSTVGIALDIGKMIAAVEHGGHDALFPSGKQREIAVDQQGFPLIYPPGEETVPIPTGEAVAGAGGDVDAVLCVVIGIDAKGICFFNGSEFGAAIGVEAQIRCLVGVVP